MEWKQSMGEGLLTSSNFSKHNRDGDQGWTVALDAEGKPDKLGKGMWTWNETWGRQYTIENFEFDQRFVKKEAKKNVMDMQGTRRIVQSILSRSCLNLSNRQIVLISDSAFSRSGSSPGILEAVIIKNDPSGKPERALYGAVDVSKSAPVKADMWEARKKLWAGNERDISNEITLEHERQIRVTGNLNMFTVEYLTWFESSQNPRSPGHPFQLSDMGISDKGITAGHTVWIRYVRAGDGERCAQGIRFTNFGKLESPQMAEVYIDLPEPCQQNLITREEFISCIMHNPLLGETIRRIGSTDHVMHEKKTIALDITIMDPHSLEEDDLFGDAINVKQSILLEVWDSDMVAQDFLGECWLPPLETFAFSSKKMILPLTEVDLDPESERGSSREARKKNLGDSSKDKNKKVSGELYVECQWIYPAYELNPDGEIEMTARAKEFGKEEEEEDNNNKKDVKEESKELTVEERVSIQASLHTGLLKLKVIKAKGLRRADASHGRDCDPFVQAWIRNDVRAKDEEAQNGGWKELKTEGEEGDRVKTSVKKNTRNPQWDTEFDISIQSGEFEARTEEEEDGIMGSIENLMKSSTEQRREEEEENVKALNQFGGSGTEIKFGDRTPAAPAAAAGTVAKVQPAPTDEELVMGANHGVEIYLSDSIREVKAKVTLACQKESTFWSKKGSSFDDKAKKYADITIAYQHLVMIFVPSPQVQQLYAKNLHTGKEYKHAYFVALQDPSSWQPMDPTRSFNQYPQFHFDAKTPQQIRIIEASENYKLLNLRYKEFDAAVNVKPIQDTDTETECYGYAKYYHKEADIESEDRTFEWRPAIIKAKDKEDKKVAAKPYTLKWVFKPYRYSLAKQDDADDGDLDRVASEVMLAPRVPKMQDNFISEHREVLDQAKTLRSMGRSDWEIESQLNKQMTEKWLSDTKKATKEEKRDKPPPITVDIIRTYISRQDILAQRAIAAPEGNDPSKAAMAFETSKSRPV